MQNMAEGSGIEYRGIASITGPLLVVEGVTGVSFDEMVDVIAPDGEHRMGRVLDLSERAAVVEVFSGTSDLTTSTTRVRFLGHPVVIPVSLEMLGRVFNAFGDPIDGGPRPLAKEWRNVNGRPINPTARDYPTHFIQTGVSAIDGMNTLIRGQKLPIFSGAGLPHNVLGAQIARQAEVSTSEEFSIVFAAMGVGHDVATYFRRSFEESGALDHTVLFLNLADDPVMERIITPRSALTIAEYLAFEENQQVLVILTDMTNYGAALREIASIREEVPGRKGYPGYLYSDLASIYERAGRVRGSAGSITQIPILTMPNDDITDPMPDLTGYITEGQIVLSRELDLKGIYPPIDVLPSLSRLMKDGIGKGHTRPDHPDLASQLYASYALVKQVRSLASIIGEEELTAMDRLYLAFGEDFERRFVAQRPVENRGIEETLDLGWEILSILPRSELHRVTDEELSQHYRPAAEEKAA